MCRQTSCGVTSIVYRSLKHITILTMPIILSLVFSSVTDTKAECSSLAPDQQLSRPQFVLALTLIYWFYLHMLSAIWKKRGGGVLINFSFFFFTYSVQLWPVFLSGVIFTKRCQVGGFFLITMSAVHYESCQFSFSPPTLFHQLTTNSGVCELLLYVHLIYFWKDIRTDM